MLPSGSGKLGLSTHTLIHSHPQDIHKLGTIELDRFLPIFYCSIIHHFVYATRAEAVADSLKENNEKSLVNRLE